MTIEALDTLSSLVFRQAINNPEIIQVPYLNIINQHPGILGRRDNVCKCKHQLQIRSGISDFYKTNGYLDKVA